MRRYALLLAAIAAIAGNAHAESELVIAIRYLHAQGTSHSHLYLYREDGKLLRQLTNDNSGQVKTGTEIEFSKFLGFYGAFELLHDNQDEKPAFSFRWSIAARIFRFAPEQH